MTLLALAVDQYHYIPFLRPLPVWSNWLWPWLAVPLCAGVSLVYKSIRLSDMKRVPREAASITFWILLGMAGAAVGLAGLVDLLEWFRMQ